MNSLVPEIKEVYQQLKPDVLICEWLGYPFVKAADEMQLTSIITSAICVKTW